MIDIIAMENQFTGEYKYAFSKISMYGTMIPIDTQEYEDRVLNIYDMLITAQNDGKAVSKIIGNNLESFCKEYYRNHDKSELFANIFKRMFRVMLILLVFSFVELAIAVADEGDFSLFGNLDKFIALELNAIPFVVGFAVGIIVIGIESIVKNKVLFKTDKIKNGVYAIASLIIFAICVAVGVVLFSDISVKIPLWIMLTIAGGYSILYVIVTSVMRYKKYGTIIKLNKINKQELKQFQKEITLDYDIRTSAEAMAERFDKMKKKAANKGKGEPTFADFVEYMKKDHRIIQYAGIFFTIITLGIAAVNIGVNIDSEDRFLIIFASIISAIVSFVIFRFAINAMKDVKEAQCIILEECDRQNIDIYAYVEIMQDNYKNKMEGKKS